MNEANKETSVVEDMFQLTTISVVSANSKCKEMRKRNNNILREVSLKFEFKTFKYSNSQFQWE